MNNKMTNLSAMIGAAFVASATLAPIASAADATFTATTMEAGYTLADNHANKSEGEHKCGEGKCAAEHKESKGDKSTSSGDKKTDGEHKCGEGKCGADKEKSKDDKEKKAE